MQDIDEVVVHLIKYSEVKLVNTTETQRLAAVHCHPEVPFPLAIFPGVLLSPDIPAQWGLSTAVPNVAPVQLKAPLGNAPPAPLETTQRSHQSYPLDHLLTLPLYLLTLRYQLTALHHQLTTLRYRLPTLNYRLPMLRYGFRPFSGT